MKDKVTLAVLANKMDNLKEILVKDIKPGVKANTEFRLKAKGMLTILSVLMAVLGAGILFIMQNIPKLMRLLK